MAYRNSLTGPVFGLRREIDRLFEDTFGRDDGHTGWMPPVDLREDANEITLEVELPGVRPENVEVTAENGLLTIRGEKRGASSEDGGTRYHLSERAYGSFARSFQLPKGIDDGHIEADFTDGVLFVHVPKAAGPTPRRIEIRNGGGQPVVQGTGSRTGHAGASPTNSRAAS